MKKSFLFIAIPVVIILCGAGLFSCSGKIEVSSDPQEARKASTPALDVFIENSGSMDGYMCAGSQLKDAVYDYVSDLNRATDTTRLYYINSQMIPYKGTLQSYVKDLDPAKFHQAGGNLSSTDLGVIIGNVLKKVNDNTVCMLISDCILDLPSKDAQKFLTNCEITIKEEVINTLKRVPDLGIEILKLSSDFTGKYFYPGGEVEMLNNVKRPYYIWIFGNKYQLAALNRKVPFDRLVKYNLQGISSFSGESTIPYEIKNKNLTGGIINLKGGRYEATILADFSSTLQPAGEVQNKLNYSFHRAGLTVEGVYPISDKNSPYTHYVNITIPKDAKVVEEELIFNSPKMPKWVKESNDETGGDIKKNLDKTTGIKYLIQGVEDAFRDENVSAKMRFKIKNK
ncbi:MAG: hypothetical protein K2N05_04740 [Muribaculaceae bacterium]|nr:hypothetical protein [Muribaculaceae bacterium]